MRGIDADGIAGFERRALREEQGQARHPGLDDVIDVGVAGDDIGQPGLRDRLDGEVVFAVGMRRRRRHGREQECEGQYRGCRAPTHERR